MWPQHCVPGNIPTCRLESRQVSLRVPQWRIITHGYNDVSRLNCANRQNELGSGNIYLLKPNRKNKRWD